MILSQFSIDGQKIAKRLSNGIDKETRRAGKLLEDYNTVSSHIQPSFSPLHLHDVLSPDSIFWTQDMPSTSCTLPFTVKKNIIEAYLLMQRSEEEQQLLTTEIRNAIDFWNGCAVTLQESIDSMKSKTDLYSCGAASILQHHLWAIDFVRSQAEAVFQTIPITENHCSAAVQATLQESDSSDTESDTDSDTAHSDNDYMALS